MSNHAPASVFTLMQKEPLSVKLDDTMEQVLEMACLQDAHDDVFVTDVDSQYLGCVSVSEAFRRLQPYAGQLMADSELLPGAVFAVGSIAVRDLMVPSKLTISVEATSAEAADQLLESGLKRLPVVNAAGQLVGSFVRTALVRQYFEAKNGALNS
jgi:Mg/Co/Ni transporter MgtE